MSPAEQSVGLKQMRVFVSDITMVRPVLWLFCTWCVRRVESRGTGSLGLLEDVSCSAKCIFREKKYIRIYVSDTTRVSQGLV